jgi:hypothetical protein
MTSFQANTDLLNEAATELPTGVFLDTQEVPLDRTELFRVNGKVYTAPKQVNPQIAFKYLRDLRKGGGQSDLPMANMMAGVLGDAVLDALADEELDEKQFATVMKVVEKHAMAATRRALGN